MIIEIVLGNKIDTQSWTRKEYLNYKRKILRDVQKMSWIDAKPLLFLVNKIDALLAYAE
jgi:hypothetical protein